MTLTLDRVPDFEHNVAKMAALSPCLTEDTLTLLLWGQAEAHDTDAALEHIASCDECRVVVARLARASSVQHSSTHETSRIEAPSDIRPGASIGRYVVLHCVGAGGMGIVYAAYDPELDRKVALKLLRARGTKRETREATRALLAKEAHALARVSHPNVVAAYDVGQYGELVTMVLEFVEGMTLRAWVATRPRTAREVLALFSQVGLGLGAAHDAGVVHRDMKPENVLVGADGRPRVTDFGLALTTGGDDSPHAPAGTYAYMAPEQLHGRRLDARADQFAFAVSLHEALVGTRPFVADTRISLLAKIERGLPIRSPRGVPVRVWRALRKALAHDPEARFASMKAMVDELTPRSRRVERALLTLVAAGAIGLAAFGLVHERRLAREAVCKNAGDRLSSVWSAARRDEVKRAFLAETTVPFRETALASVIGALDAYGEAWGKARVDVCEATRVRGEQSEALLDERMACLDDRRMDLGFLVDELAKGTPKVIERSVEATTGLRSVEACAARGPLHVASEPRGPGAGEGERKIVARARAEIDVGEMQAAEKALSAVVSGDRALGDGRLRGEAELLLGTARSYGNDLPKAEENLLEAAWSAESIGDDETVARAFLELAKVEGNLLAHKQEGERYERQADATLARMGKPTELLVELSLTHAQREYRATEYDQARTHAHEALDALEKHGHGQSTSAATAWNLLGVMASDQGKMAEAREAVGKALEIRERLLGAQHPLVSDSLNNLGMIELSDGSYEDAIATLDRVLHNYDALSAAKNPGMADAYCNRGLARMKLRDYAGARADFEQSVSIAVEVLGDHPYTAGFVVNLGDLDRSVGMPDKAMTEYARAEAILARTKSPNPRAMASVLGGKGQAELMLGRPAEAEKTLARALALSDSASLDPVDGAEIQLAMARALHLLHKDAPRTRELATTARKAYATSLPAHQEDLDAVDRFLAEAP
jgi:tetratricopeptide (TPR) repeat protein